MIIVDRSFTLVVVSAFWLLSGGWAHALDTRVVNLTLNVPEVPSVYGYQVVNALGGVTFDRPLAVATPAGETNRLFVVEQPGRIYVVTNLAAPTKTLFVDLTDRVRLNDLEEGLLGLAFHPEFQVNGFFYVFYTITTTTAQGAGRHDRLSRFSVDPQNPQAALPDSEQPLITQWDDASNHNGGDLHFGPDGYLYVSLGDEGGTGDRWNNSRYINESFFSAILRIDVDRRPGSLEPNPHVAIHVDAGGKAFYAIPPDNPFLGATSHNGQTIAPATVRTEIWATGLRNPWRMSFDPATGLLYCADVGRSNYEEVDIIEPGADYGWRYKEGFHDYETGIPSGTVQESDLTPPILEYPQTGGPAIPGGVAEGKSITGGVVYRGNRFAQLVGRYVFGDYISGRIFSLRYDPITEQVDEFQQLVMATQPTAFGVDPANGDVLIVRRGGIISRLVYSTQPVEGEPLPGLLSETGAFADLSTLAPQPGIVPYDLNLPFWSDHATKSRWFSVPDLADTVTFSSAGNWLFPAGTVWIKHFDFELTNGVPSSRRRLETRFLVRNDDGVHGFTYKWDLGQTDADLVSQEGEEEMLTVFNADGSLLREQVWRYPARSECLQCHTDAGGYALGFNTVQLNRFHDYGSGATNQIAALSNVGYFSSPVGDVSSLPALSAPDDTAKSLEHRVRSYLQANCVQCHQPGGPAQGNWDARFSVATDDAGLINGVLEDDAGDPANRVLAPHDPAHSVLLQKMSTRGSGQMPPLASAIADPAGMALITEWINAGLPTGTLIPPDITWNDPSAITYGAPLTGAQLNAQANVAGTFSYSPSLGTVLNAGTGQVLSVTFTPDDPGTYSTALATATLTVDPAALTITADNKSRTYGSVNPAFTASYSGFVNGDSSASLDTPVSLVTTAVTGSPVGIYPITASGAADANYTVSHVNGTLSVGPTALTITAENKSRTYGSVNPDLTVSYSGFVSGDTSATLDNPVILSTTATSASPVGGYPITASGAADANYTVSHVNGTLSVGPAALAITADNKSRTYGSVNPAFTASYSGFVNGDTSASLDTPVSLVTTAVTGSPVGSYPITPSGATDANYTITHTSGSLTVNPAALTILADNKSKVEGQPNPELTATYVGLVNGELPTVLTSPVTLSTTATASSPIGNYPISASGATGVNYQITPVQGTLTVEGNARFVPLELGQGNRVTIRVNGHPNRAYRVQWSSDLERWNDFASVTTDAAGSGFYLESADPAPGNRYFRILWP